MEGTVPGEDREEEDLGRSQGRRRSLDHHSPGEEEEEVLRPIVHQEEEAGRHILEEGRRSLGEGPVAEALGCSRSSTGRIEAWAGYILPAVQMEGHPDCSRTLAAADDWQEVPARTTCS